MARLAGVLTAAAWLASCAPAEHEVRTAEPGSASSSEQVTTTVALDPELARVAGQRGLSPLGGITRVQVGRLALTERFEDYIERTTPAPVLQGQQAFLVHLGLLNPDVDLLQASVELARENLAGFYDPTRATLYVAADLQPEERHLVLAHELVHALQDQHFAVGQRIISRPGGGDRLAAIHSLAEGDATAGAETDWQAWLDYAPAPDRTAFEASLLDRHPSAPRVLVSSVVAPYVDGTTFVREMLRAGGWPLVNATWESPPASTEQLLHQTKYFEREGWLTFPQVPAPRADCELLHWDTLGEQGLATLLRQWAPETAAPGAGWNGDRLDVYRCGDEAQSLLRLAFDAPSDADRVVALLHDRGKLHPAAPMLVRTRTTTAPEIALTVGTVLDEAQAAAWLDLQPHLVQSP